MFSLWFSFCILNHHLEEIAQLIYDNQFSDSENATISLGKIIDVRDGTHDSPKPVVDGFPLVTSKHLIGYGVDKNSANKISKNDFDKINKRSKVGHLDILISMIGTIGLISLIIEDKIDFAIKNVGLFKTSEHTGLVYYILCYLKSDDTKTHIESRLAGSTQKYISLGELRKLPIKLPNDKELHKFNQLVTPVFETIATLTKENIQLDQLRNTLLPKLMSGEISVAQATK